MPDPGEEPLINSAWRVVNVWAYDEDEADIDMDALGEAITALHAALEMADGGMIVESDTRYKRARGAVKGTLPAEEAIRRTRGGVRHLGISDPQYCESVWRGHQCLQLADHALMHECGCGLTWDEDYADDD